MNPWIFGLTALVFISVIAGLAMYSSRKTRNGKDFLVAGRETHPFVMAISYGSTFISTSAIIGFGGVAATYGLGIQWLTFMNIFVGIFIAFIFFGKKTRRIGNLLDAKTFPEFIAKRFASSKLKVIISLVIFLFMPFYASAVLVAGARFLQTVLQEMLPLSADMAQTNPDFYYHVSLVIFAILIAFYVILGGLKGIMYTDALLGSIMLLGLTSLLVLGYYRLGGVVEAHKALSDMAYLFQDRLPDFYKDGARGWTVMPEINTVWWWTLVSTLIFGVGIGALAQPQLVVRFMSVKSCRELNRAVMIGAFFILMTVGSAYLIGALSNVFFWQQKQQIAFEAAGGNMDRIIPLFISSALPPVVLYVFVLSMIAAAMSTLSSLYHSIGSALGYDFFLELLPSKDDGCIIRYTRIGMILGIIASLFLGFFLLGSIVARLTAMFMGICAASFLPAYVASVYWKRATAAGVWASIISGFSLSLFGLIFLHRAEAKALGLCQLLTGRDVLISGHPFPVMDPLVYALPVSALMLILVSLFTRPPETAVLLDAAENNMEQCPAETADKTN